MGNYPSKKKPNNKSRKNSNKPERQNSLESNEETISRISTTTYFISEEVETERLQQYHYLIKHLFDGNFLSPIHELLNSAPCKVLDLGCGPGTWVLDMGSTYYNNKKSVFVGIDISPTFPNQIKPANTQFIQANILDGLPFENNEFDFVYIRALGLSFSETQWLELILPDILRVIKPGGWIEFNEPGPDAKNYGPYYKKIVDTHNKEMSIGDIDPKIILKYKEWLLSNSKLTNVQEEVRYVPIGSWDKNNKLGEICQENFNTYLKNMESCISNHLNISIEEYDQLLTKFFQECNELKTQFPFCCIYAQKL
ncbi:S-adenosyl-L-methionine-dependent methyltransferase [Rhizophagus irregularis]|uniref:S-adenosyl-L-methionine-dependent methyltransferase n=3 Tax=Rhizophagus irregularis TaxID=588596 RepID=A0A2I1DQY7_9GLOM|nr:hypothetical protein GLOIN_2v1843098 [Rhizophagus irregularis DAOM 181602=DAOM 197198]EXX64325.1 hypothetical protein RirG_143830 [Rhizophagus irregularis DAOM 197198w]PKC06555.1 S-adenosyl-L-methionine-dependent methyltransferase [Rhizophagus irregularis]PKC66305.1 S-adenosyl-L-methionine-dependent methyltransferase [Rhizophagus irregularis]PKY12292.1 S-adenosyl-L-methionine-dependent methyltransferase [Rhizophagus irregularis]POG68239.1 hypothetical protein GLOIN_2v1843098 [Rhizophagus ir|eukprot:XP_025175105.1 hypothetical protein GLOIN_2v1843098 [Rhizophagus irregularis DAOM 181602=DAOM 197198]